VQRFLQQAVPDQRVVPFLMQNLVTRNDHFDWRLNLLGIGAAMPQLCAFPTSLLGLRFDGPVAVIAGTNSDYVAQRDRESFQPMFIQAEVEFIEDAGHWVHADQPAAFVASVRRVLQGDTQSSIAAQAL
jgi:pimeloyl-ACP methyl ester carboxylesterase